MGKFLKKRRRFGKAKIAFLVVASALIVALLLQVAVYAVNARLVYIKPKYAKTDISRVLSKTALTDEDYRALYRQTGLTRIGVDRCRAKGDEGAERIKAIQSCLFSEYKVEHDCFAPLCCADKIDGRAQFCYLENGDIFVSSSTHFSFFAMGHAGIVTDAERAEVLQATSYFGESELLSARGFSNRLNFLILSPVAPEEIKRRVADFAANNLVGKKYGLCANLFCKNGCERTQCAHLVWYAYKQFGIDIDGNGGAFVSPKDIARSPNVRVVQAFGFDLDGLWN